MHLTQNWEIRKPGASSRGGVVASQNRTAAQIGAEVLAAGGSAVDAVVATAFALAAVEPWNSGLGGIGFMVVHQADAGRAEVVDFGPIAPRGLDPAAFPLTGEMRTELFTWPQVVGDRNIHGPLSFMIPTAVRGYALAVERFGRMPWRELVASAIPLARSGLPVDWFTTVKVASAAADLRRYEESRRVWLPDGLPPVCPADADNLSLPLGRLAETLERLAEAGPDDFYQGEIARSIVADTRAAGGVLSAEDLAHCRARIVPALDVPYRSATFQTAPGMTAGPTLAGILGRLAERRFAGTPDAAYFETVIEVLRHAYVERLAGMGDIEAGSPTSTTHVTAADRQGGIAALTTTLLSSFGSRYVLPGTGILMNNGVMWFDPQPGRPNSIMPGRRALTNMCPVVAARDRRPWFGARRVRRAAHPRRGVAAGELCRRFRHGPAGGGAPPARRCQRQRSDRHRPPPAGGNRRAAVGSPRRRTRRARGLSGPLRLSEPGPAWGGRVQPRDFRRDVAVVGRRGGARARVRAATLFALLVLPSTALFALDAPGLAGKWTTTEPPINLAHIDFGEINGRGEAVGYHHRANGVDPQGSRVQRIVQPPDESGVYRARVTLRDPATGMWVDKKAPSTFFPDALSDNEVVDAVLAAFRDGRKRGDGRFIGASGHGFAVEGWYQNGRINAAYPLRGP